LKNRDKIQKLEKISKKGIAKSNKTYYNAKCKKFTEKYK